MHFKVKMLALTSALLMTSSLSVFAQDAQKPTLPDLNEAAKPAVQVDPSHVMAVIDGKSITAGQLDQIAGSMDPNLARLPEDQRRITTLRIYLDMTALADAAKKAGLDKGPLFEERMAIARSNVLQQLYFQKEIMDKISDADLKARYDKEVAAMPKEDEIHARHILVKTKAEAEAIIKRLEKGENFEDIAKKSSTDGSAAVGGDLGYFSHGQMVEPFEKAAFALKPGEFTKAPVETPFGWHVIKVDDKRLKQPPAFDDIKDSIRNVIVRDRYQDIIKDLRTNVDTKFPDESVAKALSAQDNSVPGDEPDEDED